MPIGGKANPMRPARRILYVVNTARHGQVLYLESEPRRTTLWERLKRLATSA